MTFWAGTTPERKNHGSFWALKGILLGGYWRIKQADHSLTSLSEIHCAFQDLRQGSKWEHELLL